MPVGSMQVWNDKKARRFADALAAISDAQTMRNFLRDVMTEKEILEISARLEAAEFLRDGATYEAIIQRTGLSSRTIARINDWIKNGYGGYDAVLGPVPHHSHTPPARAG